MARDFGPSHLLHETWVGHARVHLVWLLGFMFLSGLANLYLIWLRRPFEVRNLRLSAAWQSCNLGGFWIAYLLVPVYDGVMAVPGVHTEIFGVDENVFVFSVLSVGWSASGSPSALGLVLPPEPPVLIVGAGPSGPMAALLLARLGIESAIVERRDGPSRRGQPTS